MNTYVVKFTTPANCHMTAYVQEKSKQDALRNVQDTYPKLIGPNTTFHVTKKED